MRILRELRDDPNLALIVESQSDKFIGIGLAQLALRRNAAVSQNAILAELGGQVVGAGAEVVSASSSLGLVVRSGDNAPVRVTEQGRDALGRFLPKKAGDVAPGSSRALRVEGRLQGRFGRSAVQREQFLRTSDGRIAIDPITGEGRRLDFAVIRDGRAAGTVEVTSKTASKRLQFLKEQRIRQNGGTFILDRTTGELIDFSSARAITSRRN